MGYLIGPRDYFSEEENDKRIIITYGDKSESLYLTYPVENDKLAAFTIFFKLNKDESPLHKSRLGNPTYTQDKLSVKIASDFSVSNILESINKFSIFSFTCFVSFELNRNFTYEKTYTFSIRKPDCIDQQHVNNFVVKHILYFFMKYSFYNEISIEKYDIYRYETNQFFSLYTLLNSPTYTPILFEIYELNHSGFGYHQSGNANEDTVPFETKKYVIKYDDVLIIDDYLTQLLPCQENEKEPKYVTDSATKHLKVRKDLTENFLKSYDRSKHIEFLKKTNVSNN